MANRKKGEPGLQLGLAPDSFSFLEYPPRHELRLLMPTIAIDRRSPVRERILMVGSPLLEFEKSHRADGGESGGVGRSASRNENESPPEF